MSFSTGSLMSLTWFPAIYPTIERYWLRGQFGDDVIEEHAAAAAAAEKPAA